MGPQGGRSDDGGFFKKIMTCGRGAFSAVGGVFCLGCRFCGVGGLWFVKLSLSQKADMRVVFAARCPPKIPVGAAWRPFAARTKGPERG